MPYYVKGMVTLKLENSLIAVMDVSD
jgi:hypothetical protein